ncbi:MAG: excinuclease ABC subunit UvrC [Eubacterium sp.]|nr:excinuclease ABC subunit UvrC [Eubacterium sp.]
MKQEKQKQNQSKQLKNDPAQQNLQPQTEQQTEQAQNPEHPHFDIKEELKKLPAKPGVYLMYDARDVVMYVGKAVSLRNRVRQYFSNSRNKRLKIYSMVPQVARFEYIVTDSEVEALVLECNLIKEYRPKYNTMLMDDKAYPFIKVTVQDAYPRVLYAHHMRKDKARYFGPYPNATAVKETIDLVRKLYHLRSCNRNLPKEIGRERPCLYYHIHQCKAPCQGWISEEDYQTSLQQAISFLNGSPGEEIKRLTEQMQQASEELNFEKAASYRDLIASVRKVMEHQKMTNSSGDDQDVLGLAMEGEDAIVQVFFVRDGKLIGRDHFYLKATDGDDRGAVLQSFLKQYYAGTPFIPKELMLSDVVEEAQIIEEWLTAKRGKRVYVRTPQKGKKEKLVELAARNAQILLSQDRERLKREIGRTIGAVKEIGALLEIEPPERIEAYDISNISGFQSVGSMVVYEKGRPKKADYRKFRIKSVEGPNDYASMEEVLTRRFERGIREESGFDRLPDLIMMDGGKGQVNIALDVLGKLGLDIPVCGMVKDDRHRTRGLYFENEEIPIDTSGAGFHLITRIQDEAHRFAIEYHRLLRSKEQVHSVLDDIPQVGPARRRELMKHFQNLDEIRNADIETLKNLPSMNEKAAESVHAYFHQNQNES